MGANKWVTRGSFLLCALGVTVIVLLEVMNKDGVIDGGRLADGKVSYNVMFLALLCAPLVALAALCVFKRPNARLARMGLVACVISAGISIWGAVADYISWRERPSPTDQVTYIASFLAMIGGWAVYLVYGVIGWVMRRRKTPPEIKQG